MFTSPVSKKTPDNECSLVLCKKPPDNECSQVLRQKTPDNKCSLVLCQKTPENVTDGVKYSPASNRPRLKIGHFSLNE